MDIPYLLLEKPKTEFRIDKEQIVITTEEKGLITLFLDWYKIHFNTIGQRYSKSYVAKSFPIFFKSGDDTEWTIIHLTNAQMTNLSLHPYDDADDVVVATIMYDYIRMTYDQAEIAKYKSIIRKHRIDYILDEN